MASLTAAAPPRPARIPPIALAFALSLALHALLLLVHFQLPEYRPAADRGLEVVLVNARHAKAPEQAEVLAQTNIDAGGSNVAEAKPSTPLPPREVQREGDALAETRRRAPPREAPQKPVLTAPRAPVAVASRERAEERAADGDEDAGNGGGVAPQFLAAHRVADDDVGEIGREQEGEDQRVDGLRGPVEQYPRDERARRRGLGRRHVRHCCRLHFQLDLPPCTSASGRDVARDGAVTTRAGGCRSFADKVWPTAFSRA